MEWISVKDKLPEIIHENNTSSDVLVLEGSTMYVASIKFYPASGFRKNDEICWRENSTGCGCCSDKLDPDYWMPLPNPPKGD